MASFGMAFASIVLLGTLSVIVLSVNSVVLNSIYGVLKESESRIKVSEESIAIDGAIKANATTIYANVSNSGSGAIDAVDLKYMDVILSYESGQAIITKRVGIDTSGSSDEGWRVERVTFGGGEEILNPIGIPDLDSGRWDHGEVIELRIWVKGSEPMTGRVLLTLISPRGSKASVAV